MGAICTPWINGTDIATHSPAVSSVDSAVLDRAAADASDFLFALSGRKFPGACEAVIRPTARPRAWSLRSWSDYLSSLSGVGYSSTWGTCGGDGADACFSPPQVDLGVYPVRGIVQVKIDGQVIPANEYEVRDMRTLVRMRSTASAVPTVRWGWPTCQDLSLPDTEPNTFSVTVQYGEDPPDIGRSAASALGAEFAKARSNQQSRLPARLTSITRQGVTMAVLDPMQFLDNGLTGIYEADLFIRAINPGKQVSRPRVYSPDIDRHTRPSTYTP